MSQPQKYYQRFSVSQRIEHWVQVFSFTILAVTGLPQKFVGQAWAETMIAAMGSIESVRIIHRYAAVILLLGVIYHGGYVTYKMLVERVPLAMLVSWQDAKDFLGALAYNLGLRKERPKLPRYNFEEKMEYWAFVWGTVVMVITGFMLWNPIATASFMPGAFIPAAKAAHGGEALLAVLAIIVWHMYGVHIRKFNKSMFTGKLSRAEMEHEHALELEQIENGTLPPPSPPEDVARRRRVFVPVGTIITLVLLASLYWFVTFEETAISTVVAATEEGEAFQPLSVTMGDSNIHITIREYSGPESCATTDCHPGAVIDAVSASAHSQGLAAAGPNPWLAHLPGAGSDGEMPVDCLVCHAQNYQTDDLLASAQSVGPSGGDTCLRCHNTGHPEDQLHNEIGMACISCHTSMEHEIKAEVTCSDCHRAQPHKDPLLNSKHQRLDCRTCHVESRPEEIVLDTTQPQQNSVTGYFEPTVERRKNGTQFVWQLADGSPATLEDDGAMIVPLVSAIILAPENFDPVDFAQTGNAPDSVTETKLTFIQNHGVSRNQVRACGDCHGPESTFNFADLGYHPKQVDELSLTVTTSPE